MKMLVYVALVALSAQAAAAFTFQGVDDEHTACLEAAKTSAATIKCDQKGVEQLDRGATFFYADMAERLKGRAREQEVLVAIRASWSALVNYRDTHCSTVGLFTDSKDERELGVGNCRYTITKAHFRAMAPGI